MPPGSAIDDLYSWRHLERVPGTASRSSWRVHDASLRPVLLDGHPLVLSVRGERPVRLARLAEERAFRNAWRTGDVHVRADGISRAGAWAFLACALFFSAVAVPLGLKVVFQSPMWGEYELVDARGRATILVVAGLWLAFLTVPCLVVVLAGLSLRRSQIVSLEFDQRLIRVRMHCGAIGETEWREVRDLRFGLTPLYVRLQLVDGQALWLGPLPHNLAIALGWIREERFRQSIEKEVRQKERRNEMLLVLSLFAAGGTALAVKYLLGQDTQRPATDPLIAGPVLGGVALAMGALLKHLARRQRLRRK